MPARDVMTRKVTVCARAKRLAAISSKGNTHHGDTEARRHALLAFGSWLLAKGQALRAKSGLAPCLRVSVVDFLLEENIYLEAPADVALAAAGLCPAGRPRAAVPTWSVVMGSGTDMCSWMLWRSLLSSGLS